jgi:hypothetical protein
MWSKLFGGGDGLPREKVDAVVHVIDRYLAGEAELRRLQSEKQTIHPRDLPPDKRQALILHHPRAGVHARDVSCRQEPYPRSGTGVDQ